jgi:hypothetical protein
MHSALPRSCNLDGMRRIAVAFLLAAACGEDLGSRDVAVETGVVRGSNDGDGVES